MGDKRGKGSGDKRGEEWRTEGVDGTEDQRKRVGWKATRCAVSLNLLDPLLALLLPPTLLGLLGVNKAQGALPLGRRALSHPIVSLTAGHTSRPPSLCPDRVRRETRSPRGRWGDMQPLHVTGGALPGQRCPPWLHVHQRCLDRYPSSHWFRTRPCQGGAGHRRLRVLQGEPRGLVCP